MVTVPLVARVVMNALLEEIPTAEIFVHIASTDKDCVLLAFKEPQGERVMTAVQMDRQWTISMPRELEKLSAHMADTLSDALAGVGVVIT
jgi:hypothetical protein